MVWTLSHNRLPSGGPKRIQTVRHTVINMWAAMMKSHSSCLEKQH